MFLAVLMIACNTTRHATEAATLEAAQQELIAQGRRLFFEEMFAGNGRTCGTCHRAERNFALDPAFIATLPSNDPLFVADPTSPVFIPALRELENNVLLRELENNALLRERGLVLVHVDGFDQDPVLRASPHLFNLRHTGPPFGLSDHITTDLREFSISAIRQHFPRTLNREDGVDFRLPTTAELEALEAFMLSLVLPYDADFSLGRLLLTEAQQRGRDLFMGPVAKCSQCHGGPALNEGRVDLPGGSGNRAFNTGVANLATNGDLPGADAGRAFGTPTLFGIRHTGPFFHNNAFESLREAVAFYNSPEFNASPAAEEVGPIMLASGEIDDLVAFLEALTCPRDGDVNQDGRRTPADAQLALRHMLNPDMSLLDICQQDQADVAMPGEGLTPADALCILEDFLGKTSCLSDTANAAPMSIVPASCTNGCLRGTGAAVALSAEVRDTNGEIIPNVEVTFDLFGESIGAAFTNAAGIATLDFMREAPGVFLVSATVSAVPEPLEARFQVTFEDQSGAQRVIPQPCTCLAAPGADVNLGVQVVDDAGNPLVGVFVQYLLRDSTGDTLVVEGPTDAEGRFVRAISFPEPGFFIVIGRVTLGESVVEVPFYVVIRSGNSPPVIALGNQTLLEGVSVFLSLGLTDPDSDPVTVNQVASLPPGLQLDLETGVILGTVAFDAAQNSPYNVAVAVSDGIDDTETTLSWVVNNMNRAPNVVAPIVISVSEDAVDMERALADVFTDPDIATDGDVLTLSLGENTNPDLVTLTLMDTTLVASFLPDQNGDATVQLRAVDTAGASAETSVTVAVAPVPDAPRVASAPPAVVVAEDAADAQIDLANTFADPDIATDGDALQLRIMDNTNSALVVAFVFDTSLGLAFQSDQSGTATLTVRATDQDGLFAETAVAVTVTPVNDAPMASDDQAETLVRVPVVIDVLANDSDVDSDLGNATVTLSDAPANESATVQADGTIRYTPVADPAFIGDDAFSYTVTDDANGVSNTATVRITMIPIDLLVSSQNTDTILRYDGLTGAFLGPLVAAADGSLASPQSVAFGPDGNLYVSQDNPNAVLRFNGQTGAFIDVFVVLGRDFDNPRGITFGTDGHLYVSCEDVSVDINGLGTVLRYDGQSGDFLGRFVAPASGGLDTPGGLVFGPDSRLYVSSSNTDAILRYNGQSGSFLNAFVPTGSGSLDFPDSLVFGPDGNLYVSSGFNDRILRYNGQTGGFLDTFVSAGSGGLDFPRGLLFGARGDLYVSSQGTDAILRYNGATGNFIAAFVPTGDHGLADPLGLTIANGALYVSGRGSDPILRYDSESGDFLGPFVVEAHGGLSSPCRAVFGPNDQLYVSSASTDEVLRYDGQTGAFIDTFVPAGSGGLDSPCDMVFDPDGRLYVVSRNTGAVLRYDGQSGDFINAFVPAGRGGLDFPDGLVFGSDGDLYISSSNTDAILRYDGQTGAFLDVFVPTGSGGLDAPQGLAFGPDGRLYVSSGNTDAILRYDGQSGAFIDIFVSTGEPELDFPRALVFANGDLYVTSRFPSAVLRYDGTTGAPVDSGIFVAPNSGGLSSPNGLVFGPDEQLYVTSGTNAILRYDGQTGDFSTTFVAAAHGGLTEPLGMTLGPDGELYVSSRRTSAILRYSAQTGAFLNPFVGVSSPDSVIFGPDGNLYVSSFSDDRIRRYDGQTGAFIDEDDPSSGIGVTNGLGFGQDNLLYAVYDPSGGSPSIRRYDVPPGLPLEVALVNSFGISSLSSPRGLVFGPDGDLYVCDADDVFRFDAPMGILPEEPERADFVTQGLGGLDSPDSMTFGTDGNLYVSSNRSDAILRYDGVSGAFIDAFVPARRGGLSSPRGLLFVPRRTP